MHDQAYVLGHSDFELRRLILQAAVLKPITERLMHEAGLVPGMRVLDLGCGSGDVAMLAAKLVGPDGEVVGIDRSADALHFATRRAQTAGYKNILLREASVENFRDPDKFDLVIGRYVLIHQADPATFIRAAAPHVRAGGALAFHEIALYGTNQTVARVPLWDKLWSWNIEAFTATLAHPDAGGRMREHFHKAGLEAPAMFCEMPVGGGPDTPIYAWLTHTLRSLLPVLEKIGAVTAAEVDIDTFEERLRAAMVAADAVAVSHLQFCGWLKF
jgi:SAM-dependent methyltransferase